MSMRQSLQLCRAGVVAALLTRCAQSAFREEQSLRKQEELIREEEEGQRELDERSKKKAESEKEKRAKKKVRMGGWRSRTAAAPALALPLRAGAHH